MTWIQLALVLPVALLMVALAHDFMAGLDEARLWSDPIIEDRQSFIYRTEAAAAHRQMPALCEASPDWQIAS
ncbi:MAG: hypothetical protein ACT4OM_01565 [Actinomycetota bacterium]